MEVRNKNAGSKRVFGRDITNIERRGKVHSISEKGSLFGEHRHKSRSFEKRVIHESKDAINDYEQEIMTFILGLQVLFFLDSNAKRENS